MYRSTKLNVYRYLSLGGKKYSGSWYVSFAIITLIILSVVETIVETIPTLGISTKKLLDRFEFFVVVVFSFEYLLRLWTCNLDNKYKGSILGRLKYMVSPIAIIDLIAILPFYLPLVYLDLVAIRTLRLFRLFRIFKVIRYIKALDNIKNTFKNKKEELAISMVFTLFLLIISASLMYYAENDAQPDKFTSIPSTMWWAIATLTTVGYGDIYPITGLGKLFGGVIAILGIGLFALPAGILASGFTSSIDKSN